MPFHNRKLLRVNLRLKVLYAPAVTGIERPWPSLVSWIGRNKPRAPLFDIKHKTPKYSAWLARHTPLHLITITCLFRQSPWYCFWYRLNEFSIFLLFFLPLNKPYLKTGFISNWVTPLIHHLQKYLILIGKSNEKMHWC